MVHAMGVMVIPEVICLPIEAFGPTLASMCLVPHELNSPFAISSSLA
jgi:hypothetical protein